MNTFEKAQVGDKVYSLKYGEGKIIRVKPREENYPIIINFNREASDFAYAINGKYVKNDLTPDLYWSKPEIIEPEAPKRLVEKIVNRYCNVYKNNSGNHYLGQMHETKQEAIIAHSRMYTTSSELVFEAAEVTVKYKAKE